MNNVMLLVPVSKSSCGIHDYSINIRNALKKNNIEVQQFFVSDRLTDWFTLLHKFKKRVFILQYPALAYRKSFYPLLFSLLCLFSNNKIITVLHENSEASKLRRFLNKIIIFSSDVLILTNDYEFSHLPSYAKKKSHVIPIGSNTLGLSPTVHNKVINNRIVFFGLIRKNKGIEEFINLIKKDEEHIFQYVFVGGTTDVDDSYTSEILMKLENQDVELHINKDLSVVHDILLSCTYAYLIYPDGASERRGSLLAAFKAGCIIFSNKERQTPDFIARVINEPNFDSIAKIHNSKDIDKKTLINLSLLINDKFSWDTIATEFYRLIK